MNHLSEMSGSSKSCIETLRIATRNSYVCRVLEDVAVAPDADFHGCIRRLVNGEHQYARVRLRRLISIMASIPFMPAWKYPSAPDQVPAIQCADGVAPIVGFADNLDVGILRQQGAQPLLAEYGLPR